MGNFLGTPSFLKQPKSKFRMVPIESQYEHVDPFWGPSCLDTVIYSNLSERGVIPAARIPTRILYAKARGPDKRSTSFMSCCRRGCQAPKLLLLDNAYAGFPHGESDILGTRDACYSCLLRRQSAFSRRILHIAQSIARGRITEAALRVSNVNLGLVALHVVASSCSCCAGARLHSMRRLAAQSRAKASNLKAPPSRSHAGSECRLHGAAS